MIRNAVEKGSKTVWNDNCEYDGIEDRNAFCEFEGMGGTMAELKIIHSNMMAYTAKEAWLRYIRKNVPTLLTGPDSQESSVMLRFGTEII